MLQQKSIKSSSQLIISKQVGIVVTVQKCRQLVPGLNCAQGTAYTK